MGKTIKFTNHDTNKTIEMNLNANIVLVYGGNGVGKTTLSRSFGSKNYAVFNIDFIRNNVYITDTKGAKTDASTKESFSNLFLSEEVVKQAKSIETNKTKIREITKTNNDNIKNINNEIIELSLTRINEDYLVENSKFSTDFDFKLDYENNKEKYKLDSKLETTIKTEEDFKMTINKIKNQTISIDIIDKIKLDSYLKSVFIDKSDYLNPDIFIDYNKNLGYIKEIEEIFKHNKGSTKYKDWIKVGLDLHDGLETCLFCGTKSISGSIIKWKEALENKQIKEKQNLINQLKEIDKSLKLLLDLPDVNKSVYPELIKTSLTIQTEVLKLIKTLEENEKISYAKLEMKVEELITEHSEDNTNAKNYFINKKLEAYLYPIIYNDKLKKYVEKETKEVNEKNDAYATKATNMILSISERLGFNKEIIIKTDNRGSMPKIDLTPKGNNLNEYSEGQIHKLALSIFFANILLNEKEYKGIVLDDPVISLDVNAYHMLKTLLLDNELHSKAKQLIILTHNIHYLYIQSSNLFDKKIEQVKLYELYPDEIKEVDLNVLKLDDVSLFIQAINDMKDIADISTVYFLANKTARYFLDLRTRIGGSNKELEIKEEIALLELNDKEKSLLQNNFNFLSEYCRKKNINIEEVKTIFFSLNIILKTLGFPELVTKNTFEFLNTFDDKVKLIHEIKPKNIVQEILVNAKVLLFDDNDPYNIKKYIEHPRHQLTESLMVIRTKDH